MTAESSGGFLKLMMFIMVGGIALYIVVLIAATSPEMHAYVDAAEAWCQARDGELYNSQSVVHGGLHCELPNGTSVHMARVVG